MSKEKIVHLIDGQEAGYIVYVINEKGNLQPLHTIAHEEYKGKGVGQKLFQQLLDLADEKGVKIHPVCPFIVKMFRKHPELQHYLEKGYEFPAEG